MKTRKIEVKNARGEMKSATLIWPDNLNEAVTLLGEVESFAVVSQAYLNQCERTLRRIRSRRLNVRVADLSAEQIDGLKALGLYPG